MKKFIISEEERKQILGMHVQATKRHYNFISEQSKRTPTLTINNVNYYTPGLTQDKIFKFVDELFTNLPEDLNNLSLFGISEDFINNAKKGYSTAKELETTYQLGTSEANVAKPLTNAIKEALRYILKTGYYPYNWDYIRSPEFKKYYDEGYANLYEQKAGLNKEKFIQVINRYAKNKASELDLNISNPT